MSTVEIPREDWRQELDGFSRQHEGWIVRVDVTGPDGKRQTIVRDLPLGGVSADSAQVQRVAILAGERPNHHVTHEVSNPAAIRVEITDEGAVSGLFIKQTDGSITAVQFRSPMRPDEVDGVPV